LETRDQQGKYKLMTSENVSLLVRNDLLTIDTCFDLYYKPFAFHIPKRNISIYKQHCFFRFSILWYW